MNSKLNRTIFILNAIALATSLGLSVSTNVAWATKLNAPPLPHEREGKDFDDVQEIAPKTTPYKRRMDYREVAQHDKEAAEAAKQKAIDDAQKAREEQLANYNKARKYAYDANNQAVALGKLHKFAEAIALHETAAQYDPQNKQYRINLSAACTAYGQEKLKAGDAQTASGLFRKALGAASDNALAGKLLCQSMQAQNLDPSSAETRLTVGDQLLAVGDNAGAMIEYQAAMALESSAHTFMKMGDMACRFGQGATAINWYRQAIVKDPDYAAAHRQLGLVLLAQKDYTGAATSLRKAVILDAKDTSAGQTLVDIWRRQVAADKSSAENHLGLAGALQLTGDLTGADQEYRVLEVLNPDSPGLIAGRASLERAVQHQAAEKHRMAGETLFSQGLKKEALSEISQAAMAEPKNARYQFLLGEALEATGDYQGAHQAYLTCVLIDPSNNKEAAARLKVMQANLKAQGQQAFSPQMTNALADKLASQFDDQGASGFTTEPPASIQKNMYEGAQPGSTDAKSATTMTPAFKSASDSTSASAATGGLSATDRMEIGAGFTASAAAPSTVTGSARNSGFGASSIAVTTSSAGAPSNPIGVGTSAVASSEALGAASTQSSAVNNLLSQVTAAESQKNYSQAIAILRHLLKENLQSADMHHRVAVDLMADTQYADAVSEFRIASCLDPIRRDYADDLAHAMAAHKKSLLVSTRPATVNGSSVAQAGQFPAAAAPTNSVEGISK